MSIPVKVTDASVRECVLYGNLHLRGEDTDQIGTSLTVEISDAFDRWLASVKAEALREFADRYQDEADWRTPADIDPDLIREVADRIEKEAGA